MAEATRRAGPSQLQSWSDLPQDLAGLVLGLLPAYADRACFAAVCPQWRAAARRLPLPPPFLRDDACFLVNPFSRATVKLPALARIRLRPPNAAAKYAEREKQTVRFGSTWMDIKFSEKEAIINKLLVCSPYLVAAFFGSTHSQGEGGGHTSQILVCQPGASSWSVRAQDWCKEFEDMGCF